MEQTRTAGIPEGLKICVVGAGIGGCATAHFLRQHFPSSCEIHVFEKSSTVGGRVATITTRNGQAFEAGGSVIHSKNKYMSDFVAQEKLERKAGNEGKLGIFDGNDFVFVESDYFLLTLFKLLSRYGFDLIRMKRWVADFLQSFEKVYALQERECCFTTPERLMAALDPRFPPMLQATLRERLRADGFGEAFIHEFAAGICRVNYGQSVGLGAFCGAVSLAGTGGELFAVKGGNKQVPEALVRTSTSLRMYTRVTHISSNSAATSPKYTVCYTHEGEVVPESDGEKSEDFDVVFLCAPIDASKKEDIIATSGISEGLAAFARPYQQTTATFVEGDLVYDSFTSSTRNLPTMIFTTGENRLGLNSVGKYEAVRGAATTTGTPKSVWKVFSPHAITEERQRELFQSTEGVQSIDWQAYPNYESAEKRSKIFPFCVDGAHMYYVNAIEGCASAMEMSCIGAKNCVLLALNKLRGTPGKVDPMRSKM